MTCWMAQQLTVAALCHPARAGQMAVMDLSGALRFNGGVNTKQNIDGFGPFRAISDGVEQPHVEFDMHPIIFGEFGADRRDVVEDWDHGLHVDGRYKTRAAAAGR